MVKILILCFIILLGCNRNTSDSYQTIAPNTSQAEPITIDVSAAPSILTELQAEYSIFHSAVNERTEQAAMLPSIIDIHSIVTYDHTKIRDVLFWNESELEFPRFFGQ